MLCARLVSLRIPTVVVTVNSNVRFFNAKIARFAIKRTISFYNLRLVELVTVRKNRFSTERNK